MREAIGGVLFIDEAYNIVLGEQDDFEREAVGVLNTEMENRRDQFAVIAAGYEHEMTPFLQTNTGLQSRFPEEHHFYFDDYSPDQLAQIFEAMVSSQKRICGPGVMERVRAEFHTAWKERSRGFANGRSVRNYLNAVL